MLCPRCGLEREKLIETSYPWSRPYPQLCEWCVKDIAYESLHLYITYLFKNEDIRWLWDRYMTFRTLLERGEAR